MDKWRQLTACLKLAPDSDSKIVPMCWVVNRNCINNSAGHATQAVRWLHT